MGQVDIDSLVTDLTEQLNLTEQQATQLKPVLEEQYSSMRELMMAARQSGDMASARPKMEAAAGEAWGAGRAADAMRGPAVDDATC
jgi:hypothetical protein